MPVPIRPPIDSLAAMPAEELRLLARALLAKLGGDVTITEAELVQLDLRPVVQVWKHQLGDVRIVTRSADVVAGTATS